MTIVFFLLAFEVTSGLISSSAVLPSTGTISVGPGQNANYLIFQSAGINYIKTQTNGSIVYSSSDVAATFGTAFKYVAIGGNITVQSGTYLADKAVEMSNCNNVWLIFENGAVLTISNNLNRAVLSVSKSNNINLKNVAINGNGANQNTQSSGIIFYLVNNSVIDGAQITNCRRDGFETFDEVGSSCSNGIQNSIITYCGWNGITIQGTGLSQSRNQFAINNEISHCGDVGISIYAAGAIVRNNYVHDMDGTQGSNNAQWGIAVEDNGYAVISNNTITKVGSGIGLTVGKSSLVFNNNITNCGTGIWATDQGFNTITNNTITNWGTGYNFGIDLYWGTNNTASFNTLVAANPSLEAKAFYLYNVAKTYILYNTATTNVAGFGYGVRMEGGANETIIKGNSFQAQIGVEIHSSDCLNNQIIQNNLANCTTPIIDNGTGTIIQQ